MSAKNDLFELVKSLNKNEKRYFRMFASMQKGSKKYLTLFEGISGQNFYDEQKIKESLSDKKLARHFAFNKNYLKSLILRSLVMYNSGNISDIRIHNLITTAKILFRKGLYRQYFKTLDTAKKLAMKNEKFGYLIEILDMEKYIIRKEELHHKKSREIYDTAFSSLNKLNNYFKYSKITSSLIYNYRDTGIRREGKHDRVLRKQLDTALMNSPQKALSMRSLENYYRIKEIESTAKGDYPEVYNAIKKRNEVINKYPDAFKDHVIDFNLDTLAGMTDVCIRLNRLGEAEKYLNKIKEVKSVNNSDLEDIIVITSFYKFQIFLKRKSQEKLSGIIPEIENLLRKYDNKLLIDTELYIKFCLVKAYIVIKNYDKALETINSLLVHKLIHKREDLRFYLLILNLIVHYELKNYRLLNHLVRSTYRFLAKRKRLYKTETLVLKFLRKLPELKKDDTVFITDFIKQLSILKKQVYEQNAFEYYDFLEWAKTLKL